MSWSLGVNKLDPMVVSGGSLKYGIIEDLAN